jgi:CheY-like chemotaxis protein
MLAPLLASGAAEPGPAAHDPEPDFDPYPRARHTAASIARRIRRVLSPEGFRPLRVLVVDDHPDAAESLAVVLEMLGCPARSCPDGWSALAAAEEFRPQVCLIDLVMPGMDGLELAARLRAWAGGRPLAVVATTALGDAEARARTAAAGFCDHLVKPIDAPVLIDALARLGEAFPPDGGAAPRDWGGSTAP